MDTSILTTYPTIKDLEIRGAYKAGFETILTAEALDFLKSLHLRFNEKRKALLQKRVAKQAAFDKGQMPDFLPDTQHIRESDWQVAPLPADLLDRRVEITGPVDRKMVINALNSGAKVFMADFEDSNTPNWQNNIGSNDRFYPSKKWKVLSTERADGYTNGSTKRLALGRKTYHR